ncbi:hypothetical protein [Paenibacillus dakarensis]|uniref:hypothetical protein n=1 Tax=Paenibacillus dakarensis TaxID=1527293 RepID=UPI000A4B5B10
MMMSKLMNGVNGMSGMNEVKQLLFEELVLIVRTTSGLIRKILSEQFDYRPAENMRTL